jgi:hypothetical protein
MRSYYSRNTAITTIKIFSKDDDQSDKIAYIEFESVQMARSIRSYFVTRTAKNSHGKPIVVTWGFDRSLCPTSHWVCVILRNIPPDCQVETLYRNCTKNGEKVKHITKPQLIRSQFCCLVIMQNIEDAEKLCKRLNNFQLTQIKKLRAHIHPMSNLRREEMGMSHHKIFSEMNKYLGVKKEENNESVEKLEIMLNKLKKEEKAGDGIKPNKTKKTQKDLLKRKDEFENEKLRQRAKVAELLQSSPKNNDDITIVKRTNELQETLAKLIEIEKNGNPVKEGKFTLEYIFLEISKTALVDKKAEKPIASSSVPAVTITNKII